MSVGSVPVLVTVMAATDCCADSVTRTGATVKALACAAPEVAPRRARPRTAWPKRARIVFIGRVSSRSRRLERHGGDDRVAVVTRGHILATGDASIHSEADQRSGARMSEPRATCIAPHRRTRVLRVQLISDE